MPKSKRILMEVGRSRRCLEVVQLGRLGPNRALDLVEARTAVNRNLNSNNCSIICVEMANSKWARMANCLKSARWIT